MPADPTVVPVIQAVAGQLGLDPNLAVAMAQQESGLDPYRLGDYGDDGNPTSFGLYQLHIGGELTDAGLDPNGTGPGSWQDPYTNALVALTVVKTTQARTGLTGGALAAAAQRPRDTAAYAASVDSLIGQAGGSGGTTATRVAFGDNPLDPFGIIPKGKKQLGGIAGDIGGEIAKGIGQGVKDIFRGASHTRAFQQTAQVGVGLVLLGLGFALLKAELGHPGQGWSPQDSSDEQRADQTTQAPEGGMGGRSVDPEKESYEPFPDDAEIMKKQPAKPARAQTGKVRGAAKKAAKTAAEAAAA